MKTIHKVCTMIRKHDAVMRDAPVGTEYRCKECPRWIKTGSGRVGSLMCRGMAQEYINLVKFGNPWGKKYQRTRCSWPDRDKYTGAGKVTTAVVHGAKP